MAERRALVVAPRLALQEIDDPSRQMLGAAGDEEEGRAVVARRDRRAALPGSVADAVEDAAERNDGAVAERLRQRLLAHLVEEPAGVAVEKGPRLAQRPARRHGQHRRLGGAADAQRIIAGARIAAKGDRHRPAFGREFELTAGRVKRLALEEGHLRRLPTFHESIADHFAAKRRRQESRTG